MINNVLDNAKKLHIIGIGGSGTFPMVQILHQQGYEISGSDNNTGDTIDKEREMGLVVHMGHDKDNLGDVDAVIYSAAIPQDNPEIVAAKERGIPIIPRSEALGYITRKYDNCISVSGTHGKTSTTAMLTQILLGAGLDPTAVIGGKLPAINGYGRAGSSSVMTCEACEYKDTFLDLATDIGVILNVDEDHLEYFHNLDNIIKSFHTFANGASKVVIANGDDENTMKAVSNIDTPVITFGLGNSNDYYATNIKSISPISSSFDLIHKDKLLGNFLINVPGEHNIYNALAAIIAAIYVGADILKIKETLPEFRGAGRRFEILGEVNGVHIADDYAHHPKEIAATLKVASQMGFNKVWAVHQPFTYSRTKLLLDDFAKALSLADHVVLSDIMGGRETNTYNIHTKDLADKIDNSVWFEGFPEIAQYVMERAQPNDLVITLGCGDVYKCARLMLNYKQCLYNSII